MEVNHWTIPKLVSQNPYSIPDCIYIYTSLILCIQQKTNENITLTSTGNSTQHTGVTWMERKSRREQTYVPVQLLHCAAQQKLTQHCRATRLQQKLAFKKEMISCKKIFVNTGNEMFIISFIRRYMVSLGVPLETGKETESHTHQITIQPIW